jgi:hypothetical protein
MSIKNKAIFYLILIAAASSLSIWLANVVNVTFARWASIGVIGAVCIFAIAMSEITSRRQ